MHTFIDRRLENAPLRALLSWWQAEIRALLGEKLRAVLLGGSTVLDDFQPGWSDVDVCVVLNKAVTAFEGIGISGVHNTMRARFIEGGQDGWRSGQAIEGSYVTADLLREPRSGVCFVAGGSTRWWGERDPLEPFDRYLYARHGIYLFGSAVPVGTPDMTSLKAQSVADAGHFAHPPDGCLQSPLWLAGIMHWLAQTLVFWRDGELLSKTVALEREIAAGGSLEDAFRLPLALRHEGSAAAQRHMEELRENYLRNIEPAMQVLADAGVLLQE